MFWEAGVNKGISDMWLFSVNIHLVLSSSSAPSPRLVLYQTWNKVMMRMFAHWSTETLYISLPQEPRHTLTYIDRKNTFVTDTPSEHLWRLDDSHSEESQRQHSAPPTIWNSWLRLGGGVTTCRQMGRINVDSLRPSECVCGQWVPVCGVQALSGAGEPFSIFCVIKLWVDFPAC